MIFQRRPILVFSILALLISAAILFYFSVIHPEPRGRLLVWTAAENGVRVSIEIVKQPSGQLHLAGTFTPTRAGFQLYSKDLPKAGLNGLGRPTLLEVVRSDALKFTRPAEADQPVQNIYMQALDLSFPVYPPGPVTLSLPFEFAGGGGQASIEISITYMACSEKTCLPPVIDEHLSIQIPSNFWDEK